MWNVACPHAAAPPAGITLTAEARLASALPDLSVFEVVPADLLTPPDIPIRGGWRLDAAIVLDRELVALAGMEAHCRYVQACLSRRLIETRAWRRLGFVRLSDYSRERLGVAARTLEEDAHVMQTLETLPLLREALAGGTIGWTALRLIARIATPASEGGLLEKARAMTTRDLEAFVLAAKRNVANKDAATRNVSKNDAIKSETSAGDPATPPSQECSAPTARNTMDTIAGDDPDIRWSIEVSRGGRRLWRVACELASRSAGSPLHAGQVLELVTAEAMSEAPAASQRVPSASDVSRRLLELSRARHARGEAMLMAFLAEVGVVEGFAWLDKGGRVPGPAQCVDALARGIDHADAFELDRRLRLLMRAMHRVDSQMAALLRIGLDRRLFREIGFATVKLYVESRLGCSSRKAWSLIAIERASWRIGPGFRDAWGHGRISHLAATVLLPVLGEPNATQWIERAQTVTLRRLCDEVAAALDAADGASPFGSPPPPPAASAVLDDGAAAVGPDEVQMRAHGDPGKHHLPPRGAVKLAFRIPVSVAALVETALFLYRRGPEPRWRAFERIVARAVLEWSATPRHKDPVFARDGWRCTVPGCSSRRNLQDHDVLYRSRGGANGRDNRITVCAAHHLHGIHAGIVRARGLAPSRIAWELGCRPDAPPLMRLVGEHLLIANGSMAHSSGS